MSLWREATANSRHCGCVCLCGSTAMNWHLVQGELLDSLCERQDRLLCLECQDEDDGWSDILVLRCAMIELCVVVCLFFFPFCCAALLLTYVIRHQMHGSRRYCFRHSSCHLELMGCKGLRPNFLSVEQTISIFIGKREKGKKRRLFLSVRIKTAQLSLIAVFL